MNSASLPDDPLPAWSLILQGPEYRLVLPTLSILPDVVAYSLARQRGRFNARHDRDWVSLGLGRRHIAHQVEKGFRSFLPTEVARKATMERFETVAREEMESRALARRGLSHFQIEARDALSLLAQRPRDRGIVLVTAHFETFVLGIAALAQGGEVIHSVSSIVSNDPRLHPAIRNHFTLKYEGLRNHTNGGGTPEAETSMRQVYRALTRNEVVVVLCDAPALPGGPSVQVPWLGERRAMAQGAFRLAQATGSLLAAFACRWHGARRHSVELSELFDPRRDGVQDTVKHAFGFLEKHILSHPGRWWASHLLTASGTSAKGEFPDVTGAR